jgi:hypothetical protein
MGYLLANLYGYEYNIIVLKLIYSNFSRAPVYKARFHFVKNDGLSRFFKGRVKPGQVLENGLYKTACLRQSNGNFQGAFS